MKNKIHTLRVFVIALILLLSSALVSAGDFNIYNRSDTTQTYFAINGTTGNIGLGTSNPTTLLQLLNNRWISAKNYLGTGIVNMFKVNENDSIEVGATLNIGSFEFDEDSGLVTFVDMPVSSTPAAGTSESYVFKVDGENIMTIYSEADGSGGVQNKRVGIGTTSPQNTLNVIGVGNFTGALYGGTVYSGGSEVLTSYTETDPYWTGNQSSYYTKTNIDAFSLSHWTDDLGNRGYTHLTNFTDDILWTSGFNATGDSRWLTSYTETDPYWTGNQSSYFTKSDILGFSYYNLTSFDIADYYLKSNPFGFYNSTTDGAGSGLDADLLDGSEKTAFQMDVSDSCSGENVIQTIAQDGTTGCYDTYSAADDLIDDITEWQGQCTNCVTDGDVVDTLTASNYVRKSTWTDHDNYPEGCSAGQAVRVIGDTLTCIDVENATILEGYPASFFMPLNTSVVGNFSFNGGWTEGGLSIIEGDIYAQQLFVYNISHINVSHLNINGSLLPWEGFDNQFDIGASNRRWKDLYIGGDASIGGDLSLTGTMTSGTVPWARLSDHPSIEAGTGLEGGGDLSTNRTLSLTDTGVSAGGYGSTTINYPRFTVDAQGRITSASNQTIRSATTSVSGITTLTASVTSTGNTTAATPWGVKVAYDTATAKASPGTCSAGQVVQNTTTGGVECVDVDKASAVNGTGTANTIAKFTGTTTIGDSKITDDGTIVAVDSSDLYINTTSGNVGIGTTNPSDRLVVRSSGNINDENLIIWERLDGAIQGTLGLHKDASNNVYVGSITNHPLKLQTNNLTRVTILEGGNVGIGTTSPDSLLHVHDGNVTFESASATNLDIFLKRAGSSRWQISNVVGSGEGDKLTFTDLVGTNYNLLTLDGITGKVGIGTTEPARKLDISDNSGNSQLRLSYNSLYFTDLKATGDGSIQFQPVSGRTYFNAAGKNNLFYAYDYVASPEGLTYLALSAHTLTFLNSDGKKKVSINDAGNSWFSGGNVGIGTTAPATKLHVSGDVKVDGFVLSGNNCPGNMSYISKVGGLCIDQYEASTPGCEIVGNNCANYTHAGYCPTICIPDEGVLGGKNSDTGTTAVAYSKPGVAPLVGVSQKQARQMCANAGKHLCTDEEWLAAANLQGQVYYLPTNLRVSPYYCVTDGNTYCNYAGNSNKACNTSYYSGGVSGCYSSEGVYDMVGNVWEWTNETGDVINPQGTETPGTGIAGWYYANAQSQWQNTTSGLWPKYGNDGTYFPTTSSSTRAVLRGGSWYSGANAGPFCANLNYAPSNVYYYLGFRCCSS